MTVDLLETHNDPSPDHLKTSSVQIVSLTPDQWTVLRDLKLHSLDQEPIAFADVAEERVKYLERSEEEWRTILSGNMSGGRSGETIMRFAQSGDQFIGMVSAIIPEGQTTATVQHMYVDSEGYRGRGIGKHLLLSLLQELRGHQNIKKAELEVVTTQTPARELYKSVGFKEKGLVETTRSGITYHEMKMELDF